MKKNQHYIRVFESGNKNYKPVAQMRFQGQWLEKLGFIPGVKVRVTGKKGVIVLEVVRESDIMLSE